MFSSKWVKLESSINFATFRDFCYLFPKNKNPLKFKLKSSFSDSMKTIKISGVHPSGMYIIKISGVHSSGVYIFQHHFWRSGGGNNYLFSLKNNFQIFFRSAHTYELLGEKVILKKENDFWRKYTPLEYCIFFSKLLLNLFMLYNTVDTWKCIKTLKSQFQLFSLF